MTYCLPSPLTIFQFFPAREPGQNRPPFRFISAFLSNIIGSNFIDLIHFIVLIDDNDYDISGLEDCAFELLDNSPAYGIERQSDYDSDLELLQCPFDMHSGSVSLSKPDNQQRFKNNPGMKTTSLSSNVYSNRQKIQQNRTPYHQSASMLHFKRTEIDHSPNKRVFTEMNFESSRPIALNRSGYNISQSHTARFQDIASIAESDLSPFQRASSARNLSVNQADQTALRLNKPEPQKLFKQSDLSDDFGKDILDRYQPYESREASVSRDEKQHHSDPFVNENVIGFQREGCSSDIEEGYLATAEEETPCKYLMSDSLRKNNRYERPQCGSASTFDRCVEEKLPKRCFSRSFSPPRKHVSRQVI